MTKQTYNNWKEQKVIGTLTDNGFAVTPSTEEEDTKFDIDVWIGNEPVSIKSPTHKSVCFHRRITLEYRVKFPDGHWEDSWFRTGQARKYLFNLLGKLWLIDKEELGQFTNRHSAQPGIVKWRQLNAETKQKQRKRGHPHHDAVTANVSIPALKKQGIMKYIGELGGKVDWE
jgi:hypothetical protein